MGEKKKGYIDIFRLGLTCDSIEYNVRIGRITLGRITDELQA